MAKVRETASNQAKSIKDRWNRLLWALAFFHRGLCADVILRSANVIGAAIVLSDQDVQMQQKVFEIADLILVWRKDAKIHK